MTHARGIAGHARGIAGHIDVISRNLVAGWLYWPCAANRPPSLEILLGTLAIGTCRADLPRADLAAAGFGDIPCAFSFLVPLECALEPLHTVRLRLTGTPLYLLPDDATRYAL